MCIVFLAKNQFPDFPLVVLANRDEFHSRPTQTLNYWKENRNILSGLDLQAGGTWMGINQNGRFAAVTNVRDLKSIRQNTFSRGKLVMDFLLSQESNEDFQTKLLTSKQKFNPYNLLFGTSEKLRVYSNHNDKGIEVGDGIFGISNAYFETPWFKVRRGKEKLKSLIGKELMPESLFEILRDETGAMEKDLPNTGVGMEKEKLLSSIFIKDSVYGTRSSSLLFFTKNKEIRFYERVFSLSGEIVTETIETLSIQT